MTLDVLTNNSFLPKLNVPAANLIQSYADTEQDLVPQWRKLGWPSEGAWQDAGSPDTSYSDYQAQQQPTALSRITSGAAAAPASTVTLPQTSNVAPSIDATAGATAQDASGIYGPPVPTPEPKESLLNRYGDLLGLHKPTPQEQATLRSNIVPQTPQVVHDVANAAGTVPVVGPALRAGVEAAGNPVNLGLLGAGAPLDMGLKAAATGLGKGLATNFLMGSGSEASQSAVKAAGAPKIVQEGAGIAGGAVFPHLAGGGTNLLRNVASGVKEQAPEDLASQLKDATVTTVAKTIQQAKNPEDVVNTIRQLDYAQRMALTLEVGQNDKAKMLELGKLLSAADAGDMKAASQLQSGYFKSLTRTQRMLPLPKNFPGGKVPPISQAVEDTGATGFTPSNPIERALGRSLSPAEQEYIDSLPPDRKAQLFSEAAQQPAPTSTLPEGATAAQAPPALSKDLAGAKPRYNYGTQGAFTTQFASDVEKAAYITAQATKSKRDADYLKFVMDATGLDEEDARLYGQRIRNATKTAAKDAIANGRTDGVLEVPSVPIVEGAPPVAPKPPVTAPVEEPPTPPGAPPAQGLSGDKLPPPPTTGTQASFGAEWEPGQSFPKKALNVAIDAFNAPRGLLASLDYSYPLRQGWLAMRHGKEWSEAFGAGLKAWTNDAYAEQTLARLASQDRGTLQITGLGQDLSAREEQFLSRWINKVPGVRRSQQAATVFINKLRADVYDNITQSWARRGVNATQSDYDKLGKYINAMTGRGDLGNFENAATELGTALFSPRLMAGRVQAPLAMFSSSSLVRQEAIKDFLTVFGATGALLALGHEAGAFDLNLNPTSSDFGKIRVGDTRLDPWGGYQQMARFVAQVMTGQTTNLSGVTHKQDIGQTIWNFVRSKAAPGPSFLIDLKTGKSFTGEDINLAPASVKQQFYDNFMPLFIQDMITAVKDEGAQGAALTLPEFFGAGGYTIPPGGGTVNSGPFSPGDFGGSGGGSGSSGPFSPADFQ